MKIRLLSLLAVALSFFTGAPTLTTSNEKPSLIYETNRNHFSPAARSSANTLEEPPAPPDMCLQSEDNDEILQFNSSTGDYIFRKCSTNLTITGKGKIKNKRSCSFTLKDNKADRKIKAPVDICTNTGSAKIKDRVENKTYKFSDTNTLLNTCGCEGVPDLLKDAVLPPKTTEITTLQYETLEGPTVNLQVVLGRVSVIFNPGGSPDAAEQIIQSRGGNIIGKFPQVGIYIVEVEPSQVMNFILQLRQEASVSYVEPVLNLESQTCSPNEWVIRPSLGEGSWYLDTINARPAWRTSGGSGNIVIGILDEGFEGLQDGLTDFQGRLLNSPAESVTSHGTRVTALCCATGDNEFGNVGVNWQNRVRVLATDGLSLFPNLSLLVAQGEGASVINISVGYKGNEDGTCSFDESVGNFVYFRGLFLAVESIKAYLFATGSTQKFLVVNAAGNDSCDMSFSLIKPDNVVIVGGIGFDGDVLSNSNTGGLIDIAAPSQMTIYDYKTRSTSCASGTSFASPLVTGAAALVWSKEPNLSPSAVVQKLVDNVRRPNGYPNNHGAGILDVGRALNTPLGSDCTSKFLSFTEGNPGIPGDGVYVQDTRDPPGIGFRYFHLEQFIALGDKGDGLTVTVFFHPTQPRKDDFLNSILSTNLITCMDGGLGVGFGDSNKNQVSYNGVPGFSNNVTPETLQGIVEHFNRQLPSGCRVTLNDLFVERINFTLAGLDTLTPQTVDAVAIGRGLNNFPLLRTGPCGN